MFKATIDSISHEGGLLASFSGSSPALGSIIVNSDDGTYIGKIDAVIGGTEAPIAHIAHLDRQINSQEFIGKGVKIRPKIERNERQDRRQNDRSDRRRDSDRGGRRDFGRDNRRDNNTYADNDWDCPKCNNSNFARRTECNRCGEPKGQTRGSSNQRGRSSDSRPPRRDSDRGGRRDFGRDNRRDSGRGDRRDNKTFTDNDWDCKKCNNSNFSFRKECNRCGEPKSATGRSDRTNRGNRDERPRNNHERRDSRTNNNRDSEPRKFRRARGKGSGHAHNRGPKPLNSRPRRRNRDD